MLSVLVRWKLCSVRLRTVGFQTPHDGEALSCMDEVCGPPCALSQMFSSWIKDWPSYRSTGRVSSVRPARLAFVVVRCPMPIKPLRCALPAFVSRFDDVCDFDRKSLDHTGQLGSIGSPRGSTCVRPSGDGDMTESCLAGFPGMWLFLCIRTSPSAVLQGSKSGERARPFKGPSCRACCPHLRVLPYVDRLHAKSWRTSGSAVHGAGGLRAYHV